LDERGLDETSSEERAMRVKPTDEWSIRVVKIDLVARWRRSR
jgi:hypothetical protein